jgi:hypothetical protein
LIGYMDHTGWQALNVFVTMRPTRLVVIPGGVRLVSWIVPADIDCWFDCKYMTL